MAKDLYQQLSNLPLLERAWHLARNDSRTDFMYDPFRYADFASRLNDYLIGISQALKRGSYHPMPLLTIDVPKSSLSVRPGSVVEIQDRIVLFAIACLIAPKLDKKLPEGVYSWRVKNSPKDNELFADHEILKYPFLKRETVIKRLDFVEPWYVAWPKFISDLVCAYEDEGYSFLVISDIVAYFENIDLFLLRDIFLQHLPKQQKIVNFLIDLLQYWTWPTIEGVTIGRGIPQGNGLSSFLGNIYLLPLDQEFLSFAKNHEIKYLRYMDDVKVLTKDISTAREALFLMNDQFRMLRLNIQSSKTHILRGNEIREAFFDSRLDEVNEVIDEIQKNSELEASKRSEHVRKLEKHVKTVRRKKGILETRDLRLFRRLLTAFTLLRQSRMVRITLDQLDVNPDARLLYSAVRYLRIQTRNITIIPRKIMELLGGFEGLFPYQEAYFFMLMRYVRNIPREAWQLAKNRIRARKCEKVHWYVRQQAALLLGLKILSKKELKGLHRDYNEEKDIEVKRALIKGLAQLEKEKLEPIVRELVFSVDPKLQRIGRFCHQMLFEEDKGKEQINNIFRNFHEEFLVDRLYELEILSRSTHKEVRRKLLEKASGVYRNVSRPLVKDRMQRIIMRLKVER